MLPQDPVFFDGVPDLIRIAIATPFMYFGIIAAVRLAGKRSTSQMNNFDWVVTVAMGSIAASGILLKDITLLEAFTAISLLLGLQWVLTKLIIRFKPVERLAKAEPALLLHKGQFLSDAMRRERVSEDEVLAAIRGHGMTSVDQVQWVILETDATMSVLPKGEDHKGYQAMEGVSGFPPKEQ